MIADSSCVDPEAAVLFPALAALRAKGPFPCRSCRRMMLEMPGVCDECDREGNSMETHKDIEKVLAQLPKSHRHASFGNTVLMRQICGESVVAAERALQGIKTGRVVSVVAQGQSGVGKTTLAVAMFRDFVTNLWPASRSSRFMLYDAVRDCAKQSPLGQEPAEMIAATRASLLIVDDVFAPERRNDALAAIVSRRHQAGRPTIITTSLTVEDMAQCHGEGTARRLFEARSALAIRFRKAA